MSEVRPSSQEGPKRLSGLCYDNTVIDRKGRIRKLKPPVPIKPIGLSTKPIILTDFPGQRQNSQHQNNDALKTEPNNLNARNSLILELNANEPTRVHGELRSGGEVIDNDANQFGCTEPIWKERPGAKQTVNPEIRTESVTAAGDSNVTRDRQEALANRMDIITDVDNYKQVLVKSAQLRFKVQKIRKHKIDRIEDGIATAPAATSPTAADADATDGHLPQQHPEQEPNRNVYELALEALEDDDDDDEDDDDDDEEDGGRISRRSESPDTLVERILEDMGDDGVVTDFDGETIPEKPRRRKPLYNREKSFSDEILERFGETTTTTKTTEEARIPDVAPIMAMNFKSYERSTANTTTTISSSSGSTKRNGMDDGDAVWVQSDQSQHAGKVRGHSDLSSAAAAAVIRLDRYIIDQEPADDVEPVIGHVKREVNDAEPNITQVEPRISDDTRIISCEEPKLHVNHVDVKISHVEPMNSQVNPEISHADQENPKPESSSSPSVAIPSNVTNNQSSVVDTQTFENLSSVAVQPTETAIQLTDPRRLIRERSPEEIFEEIVESMMDMEGDYEADPLFLDWPQFFPTPRKTPESIRGFKTTGSHPVPIDYSVENDWLSFFYCNRVNAAGGSAAATPPQRRASQDNQASSFTSPPAADGVGIFMNASLSASTSWMARPVKDTFQRTNSARRSDEHGDTSQVLRQPEEVSLKSTEPTDVAIQSGEGFNSRSSRSEEQMELTTRSGRSSSITQRSQPDLLRGPTSSRPTTSGQSSTETLLAFPRDSLESHEDNFHAEVDVPQSTLSSQTVLQTTVYRNLESDLDSRPVTGEKQQMELSDTDTKSVPKSLHKSLPEALPKSLPESVSESLPKSLPESLPKSLPESVPESLPEFVFKSLPETLPKSLPEFLPAENTETLAAIEKSPELIWKPNSLRSVEKPLEVLLNGTQIDATKDDDPTEILFAALDAAFARSVVAPPEVKSRMEKDIDSDDDTDGTLTPTNDVSHTVLAQSHRDTAASRELLESETRGTEEDTTEPVDEILEDEKVSEARLEESGDLERDLAESEQLESETEMIHSDVETVVEEGKRLAEPEIAEPSPTTESSFRVESNRIDDSRHPEESTTEADDDVLETHVVSESEKPSPGSSDDVAETEADIHPDIHQTVANRPTVDPVTVHQPHPPKRVVKVLSDEVTTQTVLLKIAWPSAKLRDRSRDRSEQPFRELQLRRTIRMTEPGVSAPQTRRKITPTGVPSPSIANQPHPASTSIESLTEQTVVQSRTNTAVNSNHVAIDDGTVDNNDSVRSNGGVHSNGVVNSNGVLATHSFSDATPSQPSSSSSIATRPDIVVEYENEEHSHNTEVTSDNATVDVTQTDSVKVLLVPMETVYKVQDLKEIVAAVGRTILSDSRRIPVESNIRVTCEAVQSKSCASIQDRDVTVIRNTILDTYNSTNPSTSPTPTPPSVNATTAVGE